MESQQKWKGKAYITFTKKYGWNCGIELELVIFDVLENTLKYIPIAD